MKKRICSQANIRAFRAEIVSASSITQSINRVQDLKRVTTSDVHKLAKELGMKSIQCYDYNGHPGYFRSDAEQLRSILYGEIIVDDQKAKNRNPNQDANEFNARSKEAVDKKRAKIFGSIGESSEIPYLPRFIRVGESAVDPREVSGIYDRGRDYVITIGPIQKDAPCIYFTTTDKIGVGLLMAAIGLVEDVRYSPDGYLHGSEEKS